MLFGLSYHFNASSTIEGMEIAPSSLTTVTIIFTYFDYFLRLDMGIFSNSVFFMLQLFKIYKEQF